MKKKQTKPAFYEHLGGILFSVGLLIALIAIFFDLSQGASRFVYSSLLVIGLIVGFTNITRRESIAFMIATLVLISLFLPFVGGLAQAFTVSAATQTKLVSLFSNISALLVPAAFLVALRTCILTAKDE